MGLFVFEEEQLSPVEVFVGEVESLVIEDDEQLENANQLGKKANQLEKEIKAKYKEPKAEASKAHKEIVAKEKAELAPIVKAKDVIKKAIGDYLKAQKEKEVQVIENEDNVSEIALNKEKPDLGGTHVRKNWKFRVVDFKQIPRQYLIVDEAMLNAKAQAEKENASVPGIEFYCEESVVIR